MIGGFQPQAFQPAYQQEQVSAFSGGYPESFLGAWEREQLRRRRRRREEEALEAHTTGIADPVARDIGRYLRRQEQQDARHSELERLRGLVRTHAREAPELSDRARIAYVRALTQANFSALEALERELQRMLDEEDVAALMLLLNEGYED